MVPRPTREGVRVLGREDGLHRLRASDRQEVLRLLRAAPEFNVYLLAQIDRGALHQPEVAGLMMGYVRDGLITSVCCFGPNLVFSEPVSSEALEAYAEYARRHDFGQRLLVGEDAQVAMFMAGLEPRYPVRLIRTGQVLYRLDSNHLNAEARMSELRAADISELSSLVAIDEAMVLEELGFSPFRYDYEGYVEGWRRRIREQRAWVVGEPGGLVFKLEQSAVSDDAVQLSGVYTRPIVRRRGIARRAVGEMCARLLEEAPLVTLYVDADNMPARSAYEWVGFKAVGSVRSVWFDREKLV